MSKHLTYYTTQYIMLRMQPYYEQRRNEMLELRHEKKWTYQMIADKYGISRERVRQILEPTKMAYKKFWSSRSQAAFVEHGEHLELTNRELASILGCSEAKVSQLRKGKRHAVEGGFVGDALIWQEWASNSLRVNGINNNLMPFRSKFNILTSCNKKIAVHVANKNSKAPSARNVSPIWRFSIKNKSHPSRADFFMLIITKTEDVFIIPSNKLLNYDRVDFCYPTSRPSLFRWGQYHNAYHLLLT
jgi:transcriptional regulator with XRE-family HTH domain